MADIIYCEWLKLRRSNIVLIGVLGSFIVPFLVIINEIRICLLYKETTLSLNWIYEDTIMYIMLLFGPLVMEVVATYLISREYTEKTLKTIFVVPLKRGQFMMGKIIMLLILVLLFMTLTWLDIVVISIVSSLFFEVSQITFLSVIYVLVQMIKGGMLLFMTLTPFIYIAMRAKGTLIPFVIIAAGSLLNVVLSGSPVAGYYPWTITYLLQTGRLGQSGCPPVIGIAILIFVCIFGICISILRFQREDIV